MATEVVLGKALKSEGLIYIPAGKYYKDIYNVQVYRMSGSELMLLREEKIQASQLENFEPTLLNFFLQAVRENKVLTLEDRAE